MTVGAIESSTAVTSGNGLSVNATNDTSDKDMFLQLLVAQMKYQDPMNPTDSSEFLSQSAQFTALEKAYGLRLNPAKSRRITFAKGDSVIVLAES